jgi:hypothetical protein
MVYGHVGNHPQSEIDCCQLSNINRTRFLKFAEGGEIFIENTETSGSIYARPISEESLTGIDILVLFVNNARNRYTSKLIWYSMNSLFHGQIVFNRGTVIGEVYTRRIITWEAYIR